MCIRDRKAAGFGYSYPVVKGKDISKVWDLRKACLLYTSDAADDLTRVDLCVFCLFKAEDGIRDLVRSRGLGDVYKRQKSSWFWILIPCCKRKGYIKSMGSQKS